MQQLWAVLAGLFLTTLCALASDLKPPVPLSPADGAVIMGTRTINFTWAPVKGAAGYAIEIDCFHCCERDKWCSDVRGMGQVFPNLTKPTYTFDFYGAQPGRWRVWAADKQGRESEKSPWRRFNCVSPPPQVNAVPASHPSEPEVYPVGKGVEPPKAIYRPTAGYTEAARRDKVNGTVMVAIIVGADGLVREAIIVRSLRPDLDENSIRTAKTWRFEPARRDGQPVAAKLTVEFTFNVK
jgi:TonB family protein